MGSSARVEFELEWDRGTESLARLRGKARGYVEHYSRYRDVDSRSVLFVLPTYDGEMDVRDLIWQEKPPAHALSRCTF